MANQVVVGAWTETAFVNPIQDIADQVKAEVEKIFGRKLPIYEAISFRQQLVAGTNYVIKIYVGRGEYIHVQVWKHLPCDFGKVELTKVKPNYTHDDPLKPLQ